jgi:hypothetical protein
LPADAGDHAFLLLLAGSARARCAPAFLEAARPLMVIELAVNCIPVSSLSGMDGAQGDS